MECQGFVYDKNSKKEIETMCFRLSNCGIMLSHITVEANPKISISNMHDGDLLVVCSLFDLSQKMGDLLSILSMIVRRKITLVTLDESLEISANIYDLNALFDALIEFNFHVASTRTKQALSNAKATGIKLGLPPGVSRLVELKMENALKLYTTSQTSVRDICIAIDMNPRTFYRYMKDHGIVSRRYKIKSEC